MPLPKTKSELLNKLKETYTKLDHEFDTIEDGRDCLLNDEISLGDLLAYQIEWGKLLLSWEASAKKGLKPDMPSRGYKWNELGKLARSFYEKHKDDDVPYLRKQFKKVVYGIEQMINALSEAELFTVGARTWAGDKWPVVKWIQVNSIAPYSSARTKIRRWKRLH